MLRKAREKEGVQSRVEGEEERREKAGLGELALGHRVQTDGIEQS